MFVYKLKLAQGLKLDSCSLNTPVLKLKLKHFYRNLNSDSSSIGAIYLLLFLLDKEHSGFRVTGTFSTVHKP